MNFDHSKTYETANAPEARMNSLNRDIETCRFGLTTYETYPYFQRTVASYYPECSYYIRITLISIYRHHKISEYFKQNL